MWDPGPRMIKIWCLKMKVRHLLKHQAKRKKRWNLPKLSTKVSPSAEQPMQKDIPDLPEEPLERVEEVVTVALQFPSGNVLIERFFSLAVQWFYLI